MIKGRTNKKFFNFHLFILLSIFGTFLFLEVNCKRSIPITSCEQLFGGEFLKLNDKRASYYLIKDLDCKGIQQPIGYPNKLFQGKLFYDDFILDVVIEPTSINPFTGKEDIFYWGYIFKKKKKGKII